MLLAKMSKAWSPVSEEQQKSDPLMTEYLPFIATWKEPDKAAAWYEKPLHDAWHKSVSEVADMAR